MVSSCSDHLSDRYCSGNIGWSSGGLGGTGPVSLAGAKATAAPVMMIAHSAVIHSLVVMVLPCSDCGVREATITTAPGVNAPTMAFQYSWSFTPGAPAAPSVGPPRG